ncbi:hypothetical protein DFS34DRAFT_647595 [Phlyctochytrium arcticum]|nr:hypothetical protein DFS34DRAFT_647595 [Phlyctochytrium arcticum]
MSSLHPRVAALYHGQPTPEPEQLHQLPASVEPTYSIENHELIPLEAYIPVTRLERQPSQRPPLLLAPPQESIRVDQQSPVTTVEPSPISNEPAETQTQTRRRKASVKPERKQSTNVRLSYPHAQEFHQDAIAITHASLVDVEDDLSEEASDNGTPKKRHRVKRLWRNPIVCHVRATLSQPTSRRRLIKCLTAYFILYIFAWVEPIKDAFGPFLLLAPLGVTFFHPGRTLGAQLEQVVLGIAGAAAGAAYLLLAMVIMVRAAGGDGGGDLTPLPSFWRGLVGMIVLLFPVFIFSLIRSMDPRLRVFSIQGLLAVLLSAVRTYDDTTVSAITAWYSLTPFLLAGAVSLLVNVVMWPESANSQLRVECDVMVDNITECLDDQMTKFNENAHLEATSDIGPNLQPQSISYLRSAMPRLKALKRDANHELTISHFSRDQICHLSRLLGSLVRHLEGMGIGTRTLKDDVRIEGHHQKLYLSTESALREFAETIDPSATRVVEECRKELKRLKGFFTGELKQKETADMSTTWDLPCHLAQFADIHRRATLRLSFFLDHPELSTLNPSSPHPTFKGHRGYTKNSVYQCCFFVFSLTRFGETMCELHDLMDDMLRTRRFRVHWPTSPAHRRSTYEKRYTWDPTRGTWRRNEISSGSDPYKKHRKRKNTRRCCGEELLWSLQTHLNSTHTHYGLRVVIAAFVGAVWGYLSATRAWYIKNQAYWALLTVIVLLNPTLGATWPVAGYRILGTVIGALWGFISWTIAPGNAYAICALLLPFAIACWYIILFTPYSYAGVVSLLTHLIVILQYPAAFASTHRPIFLFALARCAGVTVGAVIAILASWLIYPQLARRIVRTMCARIMLEIDGAYVVEVGALLRDDTDEWEDSSESEDSERWGGGPPVHDNTERDPIADEPELHSSDSKRTTQDSAEILTNRPEMMDTQIRQQQQHQESAASSSDVMDTSEHTIVNIPEPPADELTATNQIPNPNKLRHRPTTLTRNKRTLNRAKTLHPPTHSIYTYHPHPHHSHLTSHLATLTSLIPIASKEPSLEPPHYDASQYAHLSSTLSNITDILLAMTDARSAWHHHSGADNSAGSTQRILLRVAPYCQDLVAAVSSTLSILAGCLMTPHTVPPYLPDMWGALRRLERALRIVLDPRKPPPQKRTIQWTPTNRKPSDLLPRPITTTKVGHTIFPLHTPKPNYIPFGAVLPAETRVHVYSYGLGHRLVVQYVSELVEGVTRIVGRKDACEW